jgi:hypothetical protein
MISISGKGLRGFKGSFIFNTVGRDTKYFRQNSGG